RDANWRRRPAETKAPPTGVPPLVTVPLTTASARAVAALLIRRGCRSDSWGDERRAAHPDHSMGIAVERECSRLMQGEGLRDTRTGRGFEWARWIGHLRLFDDPTPSERMEPEVATERDHRIGRDGEAGRVVA